MRAALVFGGQGFLGGHVVRALSGAGHVVELAPPVEEFDLVTAPESRVVGLLRGCRPGLVVNAAGRMSGSASQLLAGNAGVVERLVRACALAVPGVRFVHLGSAAEYGPGSGDRSVAETDPARPVSDYGWAKLRATQVLVDASARREVDGVVLRVFNPLGAGQPTSTLPGAVARQVRAAPATDVVVGRLDSWRDFVAAEDVALAVLAAARQERVAARVVNVSEGQARSVREVVRRLLALAGHRGSLVEEGEPSPTSTGVSWQQADVSLAERTLDWRPRVPIEEALARVLEPSAMVVR